MSLESRPSNSLFKRKEQLKRWEDSETNRESAEPPVDKASKIKFSDGCVFLAACAAGDTAEVERLLAAGADINTTNVDGLTALHQLRGFEKGSVRAPAEKKAAGSLRGRSSSPPRLGHRMQNPAGRLV
ncbi:hypothetical protein HPB48_003496 [Haemaphysalis longicornis]|uniref:Uncharacterized protein n=1 Tax=Haemaphysalis longicornis TaxID=44386 RepID=A0A9J6GYH5_HAELO|nr:hypothetical protein HPB48_003496 [Haemaphysalis longicornis]